MTDMLPMDLWGKRIAYCIIDTGLILLLAQRPLYQSIIAKVITSMPSASLSKMGAKEQKTAMWHGNQRWLKRRITT